jgi:NADPH-dependent F420 reductase
MEFPLGASRPEVARVLVTGRRSTWGPDAVRIANIGVGNVGTALCRAFVSLGHTVVLAAADPQHSVARSREIAGDLGARADVQAAPSNAEAVDGADMVVLAIPSAAIASVTHDIRRQVHGTIVVDPTNPVNADLSGLLNATGSAAEGIALLLDEVRVVKAFNTVFAANLTKPMVDGLPLDGFYAGDDEAAKRVVAELLAAMGFRPLDTGGLVTARALEELALLNMSFNLRFGWPWQTGWKLLGPTT